MSPAAISYVKFYISFHDDVARDAELRKVLNSANFGIDCLRSLVSEIHAESLHCYSLLLYGKLNPDVPPEVNRWLDDNHLAFAEMLVPLAEAFRRHPDSIEKMTDGSRDSFINSFLGDLIVT